jgi:hypothetical protein
VRFAEREVALDVVNERAAGAAPADSTGSARQGMGLVGMGERAHLVGAVLRTGATPSGGWRVRLTLPLHHEPVSTVPDVPALRERGQE